MRRTASSGPAAGDPPPQNVQPPDGRLQVGDGFVRYNHHGDVEPFEVLEVLQLCQPFVADVGFSEREIFQPFQVYQVYQAVVADVGPIK